MKDRVLILKNEENDFEQFYSKRMRKEDVDVTPIFKESKYIKELYHSILRRLDYFIPVYSLLFGKWWKRVEEYNTIIVFDYRATPQLMRRIKKKKPDVDLILYNWNIQDNDMAEYGKYCRISCFDKKCCEKYGWELNEQFYFYPNLENEQKEKQKEVFFIGLDKGRTNKLVHISEMLDKKDLPYNFYVLCPTSDIPKGCNIHKIGKSMNYNEVIEKIKSSSCVLEIVNKGQVGLTARAMEALFYRKKLITDNTEIIKCDFYNKNNIFVLGLDPFERIDEFFNAKYENVSEEIMERYTYEAWLKRMIKKCE